VQGVYKMWSARLLTLGHVMCVSGSSLPWHGSFVMASMTHSHSRTWPQTAVD